jgi:hypothetical protein
VRLALPALGGRPIRKGARSATHPKVCGAGCFPGTQHRAPRHTRTKTDSPLIDLSIEKSTALVPDMVSSSRMGTCSVGSATRRWVRPQHRLPPTDCALRKGAVPRRSTAGSRLQQSSRPAALRVPTCSFPLAGSQECRCLPRRCRLHPCRRGISRQGRCARFRRSRESRVRSDQCRFPIHSPAGSTP